MKKKLQWSLLAAFLLACNRNIQNEAAVKEGVMAHLKTRNDLDISRMDVEIGKISFRKGEADATVVFRVKGTADAASSMSIGYTLEEQSGKWVVKGRRSSAEGDPHGPSAAPPTGALPPGHPPASAPSGAKP